MNPPITGRLYDFELEGAQAEAVLVLSENDWNERTRDVVIVPVYRGRGTGVGNVRVEVAPGLVADCTRIQNVPQDELGRDRGVCPTQPFVRVRIGVRIYLDIDRLRRQAGPKSPLQPRSSWWPRQGDVRYVEVTGFPEDKMYCVMSEDDWNSRDTTIYSAGLRLTSKTRSWRSPWEVQISSGWIVTGHLYSLLLEDFGQQPPRAPRPQRADSDELEQLANGLATLLGLG